jgi:hypothetical protein
VLADRQREIEHNIRIRRLLDGPDPHDRLAGKPGSGIAGMPAIRPTAPRPAGPSGPACEAL